METVNLVWEKLIVALDVTSSKKVKDIVAALSGKGVIYKIGLIPYTKFGPRIVKMINASGAKVFLDLKLYDIPNTMAETVKLFVKLGVWGFTIHAKSGQESLQAVKKVLTKESLRKKVTAPLMVAVTELTSQAASVESVLTLAKTAKQAGADALVCSVWEAKALKQETGLITITPGIRLPEQKGKDDQTRVATVSQALQEQADYFVVGRPIVGEKDYLAAANRILAG